MLIYRFEDYDGLGPYSQTEHYFHFAEKHNNNMKKYPIARLDTTFSTDFHLPTGEYMKKFSYGFDSIKQAKKWFNASEISEMYDFQVFCYAFELKEDSDLYISNHQVLFRKDEVIKQNFVDESELLSKSYIEKRDAHFGYE